MCRIKYRHFVSDYKYRLGGAVFASELTKLAATGSVVSLAGTSTGSRTQSRRFQERAISVFRGEACSLRGAKFGRSMLPGSPMFTFSDDSQSPPPCYKHFREAMLLCVGCGQRIERIPLFILRIAQRRAPQALRPPFRCASMGRGEWPAVAALGSGQAHGPARAGMSPTMGPTPPPHSHDHRTAHCPGRNGRSRRRRRSRS
jgi:hypothetical protein